jgi:hypothetical protein
MAGAGLVVLAFVFLALGFGWMRIQPGSRSDLTWLASYFAFSAFGMLGLALRFAPGKPRPAA